MIRKGRSEFGINLEIQLGQVALRMWLKKVLGIAKALRGSINYAYYRRLFGEGVCSLIKSLIFYLSQTNGILYHHTNLTRNGSSFEFQGSSINV